MYVAKVSFHDVPDSAVDAVLTIADEQLSIAAGGRFVGRWPISDLSPQLSGESVVVSAEGERLVIDVTDASALRVSLGVPEHSTERLPGPESHQGESITTSDQGPPDRSASGGSNAALQASSDLRSGAVSTESSTSTPADDVLRDGHRASTPGEADVLRGQVHNLRAALASAQEQLRWVQDLVPRRLPISLRGEEAGLGVVQGVRLKERRPVPGTSGRQPWVVVDSGNVYVTDRRLVFSGAQDVEFVFDEINKKGASPTGLLLGVSSRTQAHILAGPGERLAVVLTAAEKISNGRDPSLPFREAISRLTSEKEDAEGRLVSVDASADDSEAADQSAGAV